jgi:hypothetical protein
VTCKVEEGLEKAHTLCFKSERHTHKKKMTGPPPPTSALPAVKALLILDSEGRRIAVKYYTKEW